MFDSFIDELKSGRLKDIGIRNLFAEKKIEARTVLLREGEISDHAFYVRQGCLREWFNKDGKEITFQFFFEGQTVASIDSFMNAEPSLYNIESIEPATVVSISRESFEKIYLTFPEFRDEFQKLIYRRFRNYANLFVSRIRDTPRERYEDLIRNHPEIIQRVPQYYIASYLGITPISLSRIRNRR